MKLGYHASLGSWWSGVRIPAVPNNIYRTTSVNGFEVSPHERSE